MRRLAQQLFNLLRKRAWLGNKPKAQVRMTRKLLLEALEDRFLPATSVTQLLPAALTGTAFIDHNDNGILDPGEVVLPGATITLTGKDANGKAVSSSTTTDANGVYKFLELTPGTYNLSISTNGSFLNGLASAGSQGGIVSGSVVSSISITQGETAVGYNLAVIGLANVGISLRQFLSTTLLVNGIPTFAENSPVAAAGSGVAYVDGAAPPAILTAVGTGSLAGTVTDTSGNAIANVTIGLTGVTGSGTNAGLPTFFTTTTDSTGAYSFNTLASGSYSINLASVPSGFRAGTPALGNLDGFISNNDLLAGVDVTTTAGTGYDFTEIPVTPLSGTAATIEAHLLDDTTGPADTGGTTSDTITSDPTIAGEIANVGHVTSFTGVLDGAATAVSLPPPNADGTFILSRAFINQMASGGVIADGHHTLNLAVTGDAGFATTTVTFTLQSTAPLAPTVHLDTTSDPSQNGRPISTTVTILGTTSPNVDVDLIPAATGASPMSVMADANGNFSFAQTLAVGPNDFTIRVTDSAGNQNQTTATFVAMDSAPVASTTNPLAAVNVTAGAANQILDLASNFTDADTSDSILQFHTSMGDINVQLDDAQDPQTVTNFLNYVKSGEFNNTIFHRLATGFVLQGGGFTLAAAPSTPTTITPLVTGPTIENEFPPAPTAPATQPPVNVRGTLAMAKVGSNANSATSQFFFNLADNSSNLDTQNGGFTVFATIADGFSQRIVDDMASEPVVDESAATGAAVNTVETITVNGTPTGGTFTLNNAGVASAPIAFNASATDVQNAIAGLPAITGTGTIGTANVIVTGSAGNFTVTFVGNLAGTSVPQLTAFSSLTGGNSPSVSVTVATPGSSTNSALSTLPLVNYSGTNFPADATAANFEVLNSVSIVRNTEFLTYTVTNNSDPAVASATLDPVFNNRLTLQFLTPGTTTIAVVATDLSNESVTSTFTVTVAAPTTNPAPVIAAQTFTAAAGSANGTVVGNVQANDPTAGEVLAYSITAGNTNDAFAINSTTGQITVADTTQLNITAHPTFALTVQVTDNGTPAMSSSATVTVNLVANTAPTINAQSFTVAEGSATDTVLGTVAASGANNQSVTYAITGGNTDGTFQINSTGQLSVASGTDLVLATNPSFALTVTVTDMNSPPASNSAPVTVQLIVNHAPTIPAPQNFGVPQGSSNGTVVGTVSASDQDPGQTLTYAIVSGNTDSVFALNASTGQITVADNTNLNADAPYQLVITVTDNDSTPLSSEPTTINIQVPPANNPPTVTAGQTFNVVDGAAVGAAVGTVAATDPDAGQTLTYAITGGNTGNTFQINSATGQITVANNADLNIAVFPSFTLEVQVTDNGFPPLSSPATSVTINLTANQPPTIAAQTFNVAQGSVNGTVLGTVAATDPVAGQTLTYAISAGNANGAFAINSTTGQITVADTTKLSAANLPVALTVQVTDNNARPLQSSATITVNVTANHAPVVTGQNFNVLLSAPNGTVVGTVAATDPDAGQTLTYAIIAGNANGAFAINSTTGQITVADTTQISAASSPIALTVQATDNAVPPLSTPATVNVTVTSGAIITAALANDTGSSSTDGITSDPTVSGTVTNVGTVTSFRAGLDDPNSANWVDVTGQLSNGTYTFTPAEMATINHGTALLDGAHTLSLQVTDSNNNTSAVFTLTFTLKTSAATPTLDLDPNFDTNIVGDHITSLASVSLDGTADAGASVVLKDNLGNTIGTATADSSGNFTFTGVALQTGDNIFTVQATDVAGNQATFSRTITRQDSPPVVSTPIANVAVLQSSDSAGTNIDLAANFTDPDMSDSIVQFNTSDGPIDVQLFDTQAPQTVANFFDYVQAGAYNNTIFHRLVAGFVLQGGGFTFDAANNTLPQTVTLAPVPNEFGVSNTEGTIAMAKLGSDPNSATDQFFFNLADNSSSLDSQNGGFTVFGKIVGAADQAVLSALAATPVSAQAAPFDSIPLNNYTGTNFPTDATAANFLTISSVSILKRTEQLTYSVVSNTNAALVTPSLASGANEMLTLQYAAGQTGTSTIVVRATDQFGATVDQTFTVTVS